MLPLKVHGNPKFNYGILCLIQQRYSYAGQQVLNKGRL